jgi:hypothetical protein
VETLLVVMVVSEVDAVLAAFSPNIGQDSSSALNEPTAMVPSMRAMADAFRARFAVFLVHQFPLLIHSIHF